MSIGRNSTDPRQKPLIPAESEKSAIRARAIDWRLAMNPDDRSHRSAEMTRRALTLPELTSARTVHVYWPSEKLGEIDTRPLIEVLHDHGSRVVLPVVVESTTTSSRGRLRHVVHAQGGGLSPNRWGILEPTDGVEVDPAALDTVIVPALACDVSGYRLGFGYGFYDEFLSQTTATRICLCHDELLLDSLPHDSHDERVHIIVTESRVIRPLASLPY